MTIFIPVLFLCIAGNCEFMQQTRYFTSEALCQEVLVEQKQKMHNMATALNEVITQMEGTCIDATIQSTMMVKGNR